MATDDQQVLVTGRANAPAHFRVPGNGQVRPKAVFATFDGTSAVGDFQPALKITSDGGELVGVYPTDTTVTAGGSVDVSWAPFLGRGAAATTATTLAYAQAYRDNLSGVADPVQNVGAGVTVNGSFPHASTTDSAIMSWFTSSQTNDTLLLTATGTYLIWVTTHWDNVNLGLATVIFTNTGTGFPHTPWEPLKTPLFGAEIGSADNMDTNIVHVTTSGRSTNVAHSNNTANPQAVQQCYFTVVYLGTG